MMRTLLQVVTDIVTAAGLLKEFQTELTFHLKLEQPPYIPLVIEAWNATPSYFGEKRHISVAHYFEQNGDLVADPELCMTDTGYPIELTQVMGYTPVVFKSRGPRSLGGGTNSPWKS